MQHGLIQSSVVVARFFVALVGEDTKAVFGSWVREYTEVKETIRR